MVYIFFVQFRTSIRHKNNVLKLKVFYSNRPSRLVTFKIENEVIFWVFITTAKENLYLYHSQKDPDFMNILTNPRELITLITFSLQGILRSDSYFIAPYIVWTVPVTSKWPNVEPYVKEYVKVLLTRLICKVKQNWPWYKKTGFLSNLSCQRDLLSRYCPIATIILCSNPKNSFKS